MAGTVPRGLLNTDLLSLYEERLKRIVEECYEVAFILCNRELEDFGVSKVIQNNTNSKKNLVSMKGVQLPLIKKKFLLIPIRVPKFIIPAMQHSNNS